MESRHLDSTVRTAVTFQIGNQKAHATPSRRVMPSSGPRRDPIG